MKIDQFNSEGHNIESNDRLRVPQREGYVHIRDHFQSNPEEREIGIVLAVGCGKSGLITISPYAVKSRRTLVIAPGLRIKGQLFSDFDPANADMFFQKCHIIDENFPEPSIIEGSETNISDLEESDVVVTNIQQIQGEGNVWPTALPDDFFDLILVDEAHHNVAESWNRVREKFPNAKIINFSATPTRADGQLMEGNVIYSFPIFRAIELGYIKRLKAKVLNPESLKYVRDNGGVEVEVTLDQIRTLGETDATFRRSIVSSEESLKTIVDCSIRELQALRARTGDNRHKIIASALNFNHCIQINSAYEARGLRSAYIHSREDSATNERNLQRLDNDELDVIVQVRMLGEGFDHKYLSVAAVCSVFSNLAPFAQFVGRIMRVVDQNAPESLNNQGIVVFHAGSNIANRWSDFQEFSEADQEYFDQLLPLEDVDFNDADEVALEPRNRNVSRIDIMEQEAVSIEEVPLLEGDEEAREAIELLRSRGYNVLLRPIPVTSQRRRRAGRRELDSRIRTKASEILSTLSLSFEGRELDTNRLNRSNFVIVKAKIDRAINQLVGRQTGERGELSNDELDIINGQFDETISTIENEIRDATT